MRRGASRALDDDSRPGAPAGARPPPPFYPRALHHAFGCDRAGEPRLRQGRSERAALPAGDSPGAGEGSACGRFLGRTVGGRFSIVELIAQGGMGAVFRGREAGGDGDVAVKILLPSLAADPAIRARFAREVHVAAQIHHPNAVRILDHGTVDGSPYLVMDLVEGRELFDVLAESGGLPEARATAIVVQICDVVATAHELGIIHRDLKPENVMLTQGPEGEHVVLLDFGVAKHAVTLPGDDDEGITVVGAIVGTPGYMAPEQCLGNTVDVRSDVYACGALLYHLITGRPLFEDENPFRTYWRHINEVPRPPSQLVPGLSPALEATILKALEKRPEDRQQSALELREELLATLPHAQAAPGTTRVGEPDEPAGASMATAAPPEARTARPLAPPRRRRGLLLLLAVLALSGISASMDGQPSRLEGAPRQREAGR